MPISLRLSKLCADFGLTPYGVRYALEQYQKVIVELTDGKYSKLTYPAKLICDTAREPKRGRWIKGETSEAFDIAGVKTWALKAKCSECGFVHKFIEAHMCYGYCPNCGAKMEGSDTDD